MNDNFKVEGKEGDWRKFFGRILKKIRIVRGKSQKDLAHDAEVDAGYISRIENGHRNPPSPKILLRLATALNVDSVLLMLAAGYLQYDPVSGVELTEDEIVIKVERSLMSKGT